MENQHAVERWNWGKAVEEGLAGKPLWKTWLEGVSARRVKWKSELHPICRCNLIIYLFGN